MNGGFKFKVLVVDDEEIIRFTSAKVLETKGFDVRTAGDGFEALIELREGPPDVIISDLRMPNMSGFELLSIVRKRFPHTPVIAISGEYNGTAPEGLIADHFFSKGNYRPEEMFSKTAELISRAPHRPNLANPDRAPVWLPRNAEGYFVVTCTDCLRSFSVPSEEASSEVCETTCPACGTSVKFLADPSEVRVRRERPK